MNQYLAYGDIIRIYCTLQDIQDKKSFSKISGFLVSKGFADNNIYFLKSKIFTQFELRNSLFQILPYSSFEIHDEKKHLKNTEKSKDMQNIQSRMDTEKDQFQSKCKSQQGNNLNFDAEIIIRHVNSGSYLQGQFSCPETGIGSFKLILSDEFSSWIKFKIIRFRNSDKQAQYIQSKDEFRLYHCASHCYLNLGDQNQEIFLDKEIELEDSITSDFQKNDEAHIYRHIRPKIKKPLISVQRQNRIKRYEVVNQSKATLILNFLPEKKCTKTQDTSKIQRNDVVYILNTNNNSYLVPDLWTGQVNLKSCKGDFNDFPYQGLWEVCVHRDAQKGVSSERYYYLKHYITDMVIKSDEQDCIRIDNQISKTELLVKIVNYPEGNNVLKHRSLVLLENYDPDYNQMKKGKSVRKGLKDSIIRNQRQPQPQKKQYLDISTKLSKIHMSRLQQKIDQKYDIFKIEFSKNLVENTFQIFKFDNSKLKSINKILSCVETLTKFCDILIKFSQLIQQEIKKLKDLDLPPINIFQKSHDLNKSQLVQKSMVENQKTRQQYGMNIQQFFSKFVNHYILSVVINTIKYLTCNTKTGSKIQFEFIKMVKSLGVIQILVQNIFFIERAFQSISKWQKKKNQYNKQKDMQSKKKYERDRLTEVFKQIYYLLISLSQQNQCRLYIAKWMKLFLRQFYNQKEDFIHQFILQLLSEQFITKECISNQDIQKCIQQISNSNQQIPNYKFLQLLSAFCCTKKAAIPQHQKYIIQEFICKNKYVYRFDTISEDVKQSNTHSSYQSNKKKLKIRIKLSNKGQKSDYILMADHAKFKKRQLWTYIIFLLNLVADLSFQQRCKEQVLEQIVNIQVIRSFFLNYSDQDITNQPNNQKVKLNNIYLPFLKLAHYFFINLHEDDSEQNIVRLQRNQILTYWNTQDNNYLPPSNSHNDISSDVTTFFQQFFKKQSIIITQYNPNRLRTIEKILEFIKSVMKYGNWTEKNYGILIPLIIKSVLKLKKSVIEKNAMVHDKISLQIIKQNVRKLKNNKQILRLLIDTRNIATEILDIRMDIINNKRLAQLDNFFKEFYQNNIDTGNYYSKTDQHLLSNKIENPCIWVQEISKKCEKNVIYAKQYLVKCLIESIFVDSLKIVGKVLNIIFKLYESKSILVHRFSQNFIVYTSFFNTIASQAKNWIANFQRTKGYDHYFSSIKQLSKFSDAIRHPDIKYKEKNERKGQNRNQIRHITLNEFQTKFNQKQQQMQKLLSNLKIHQYLIKFLNKQQYSASKYLRQDLNIIYEYLTLLVFDNSRNQRILSSNLNFTLCHLRNNTKNIDFVIELFRNNKKLLFDKDIIMKFANATLQKMNQTELTDHELRAKLFCILRTFCLYNNKTHSDNQKLILSLMQNKKYHEKVIFSTATFQSQQKTKNQYCNLINFICLANQTKSEPSIEDIEKYLQNSGQLQINKSRFQIIVQEQKSQKSQQKVKKTKYDYLQEALKEYNQKMQVFYIQDNYQQQLANSIEIPPPILQLMSYFSTMSALVEGNNEINIGKCQNMHPYQSLIFLLYVSRLCWPLIRHIRSFMNKVYYTIHEDEQWNSQNIYPNKIKSQFFLQILFNKQIKLIHFSLNQLVKSYYDKYDIFSNILIKNPIRYQYLISYIYACLLEVLSGIYRIFNFNEFQYTMKKRISQKGYKQTDSQNLFQIIQLLGVVYKKSKFQDNEIRGLAKGLYNACCHNVIPNIDNSRLQRNEDNDHLNMMNSAFNRVTSFNQKGDNKNDLEKNEFNNNQEIHFLKDLLVQGAGKQKYVYMKKHFEEQNTEKIHNNFNPKEFEEENIFKFESQNGGANIEDIQSNYIQMQINKQLEKVIISLSKSSQVKTMIQDQFDQMVSLITNLDNSYENKSESQEIHKIIGKKQFLTEIIKLVTKSPIHLTIQNKIKAIKLIRLVFQKQVNDDMKFPNRTKWRSYHFQKEEEKKILKHHQQTFKDIKLAGMIVAILKLQNINYELLYQTFLIGISFLYNGNTNCQKEILNHLKKDTDNMVITQLCNFIRKIKSEILAQKFVIPQSTANIQYYNQDIVEYNISDSFEYFDTSKKCLIKTKQQEDTTNQSLNQIQMKINCVCAAYNFLQLLCQNDNIQLKNFLRQQINTDGSVKYNTINFLAQTTKLFKVVLEVLDSQVPDNDLLQYLSQFFIEVTQIPCLKNQRQLVSTSIFSDIKKYAKQNPQNKSMCYLFDFVINVSLSLLEGNQKQIYEPLLISLDSEFMQKILVYQKEQLEKINKINSQCPEIFNINKQTLKILVRQDINYKEDLEIKNRLSTLFNLLSLIKKLSIYQEAKKQKPQNILLNQILQKIQNDDWSSDNYVKKPSQVIRDLYDNYLLHIEVVNQGKKQFIYFPNLPIFDYISQETKNYILLNVKREKQIDKMTDFISKSVQVNQEMNWNYKVENRLSISSRTLDLIRNQILILTIIIQLLFVCFSNVFFTEQDHKLRVVKDIQPIYVRLVIHFLCNLQLFGSIYFLFIWFTLKYRLSLQREMQSQSYLKQQEIQQLLHKIDKDENFQLRQYCLSIRLLSIHQPEIYNTIFFVTSSLLGYMCGYQYYSLLVFDILTRNETLQNVIQAITRNIKQLLFVSLLILVFVYIFNLLSIEFDLYLPFIYLQGQQKCQILSDCIMSLYASGIVGKKNEDFKIFRFFTDLVYVIIMELLFSNIVSGIMIDTFAQLRDTRKIKETDQKNICFICGVSKATLEKRMKQQQLKNPMTGIGSEDIFNHHITQVHFQWNYLFYLYILSQKNKTQYTGIEYMIYNERKQDRYNWIPMQSQQNESQIQKLLQIISIRMKQLEPAKEKNKKAK